MEPKTAKTHKQPTVLFTIERRQTIGTIYDEPGVRDSPVEAAFEVIADYLMTQFNKEEDMIADLALPRPVEVVDSLTFTYLGHVFTISCEPNKL